MQNAYAGNNITGTKGLIAVDKVGNTVRFYDPKTLTEISSFPGPEKSVHELAISPLRHKAYIPIYGDGIYGANKNPNNKILEIDLQQKSIARTFNLGDILAPHGMAVAADGLLWVVCDIPDLLICIDTQTGQIAGRYPCPGKGAHQMALSPDGSTAYVSHKEGPVGIFDLKSRTFTASLKVSNQQPGTGNGSGSEGIMPSPDGKHVLVIDNTANDLLVFDSQTQELLNRIELSGNIFSNPKRSRMAKILFSPDAKTIAITAFAAGLVWIMDAADMSNHSPVNIAKGPQGMAFHPDGETLIVSSHDSGLLTVIDRRTKKATAALDGGSGIEVLCWY
jgi:DNA-binding beta-propeller fold protein YncE